MKRSYIRRVIAISISLACGSAIAQESLGAAGDFTALGGSAVTCTDSVVVGDVGVNLGGAITQTNCTITGNVHEGDLAAQQGYLDFLSAYDTIAQAACDVTLTTLSGLTLQPGVYCVDAAATETGGVLTLDGSSSDEWIFKIGTAGTGALTGTGFTVVMPGGETCNNNVFWWTQQAATLTDSVFIGSILAGTSITITGGSFDGQALATDAVTLTNTEICATGGGSTFPLTDAIKVTGGGQIAVPNPDSSGRATFGFNAQPGKHDDGAKGHFNYVNHVTGLHVNGEVEHIEVIALNPDNSPKTVRFTGTCEADRNEGHNGHEGHEQNPQTCAFSVTVEDNGEPGRNDEFGVRITGDVTETRSQRVIERGNIQFHSK